MIMRKKRKLAYDLFALAILISSGIGIATVQIGVDATSSGYTGAATKGCNCHGSSASSAVTVTITGQPVVYTPLTKYPLTVTVTGGPSPGAGPQGGFDLGVTGGFLTVPSGSTDVQIAGGEATHTEKGNAHRQWSVDWTAPAEGTGSVSLNVMGMSANGDGADSGDQWNKATYTVPEKAPADTTRPGITITAPTEGQQLPYGTTNVLASGTASDNVGVTLVEVSNDGINWQSATGTTSWTATLSVLVGSNIIRARAKDAASNIGTAMVNISVLSPPADIQRPTITITQPTEAASFPSGTVQVDISGTASDNVGVTLVEISSHGGSWTPATGTSPWTANIPVQTGSNMIHARASDAALNTKEITVNITVESPAQDNVPPQVSIIKPTPDQVLAANTTTFNAEGTASDNVGVQKVEFSMDGTSWSLAIGNTTWSAPISVKKGPNTLQVRATDTSGNTALGLVTFSVAIPPPPPDTTKPVLMIDKPTEGGTFPFGTKQVEFSGTVTDNKGVKDVRVSTDGTFYMKASGNTTWSYMLTVSSGTYKITVQAEDLSKNIDTHTINITILPDTTVPLLVITSHSNGATLPPGTNKITLTGQAFDNDKVQTVEVSKDNETWTPVTGTGSWSAQMKVGPGKNTFYVRATDINGNVAYASVVINVNVAKQNLWIVHVVLLTLAVIVASGLLLNGWRIRRDKTKRPPKFKIRRRKLHLYVGPVFSTIMVIGFVQSLINRYLIRGVVITSIHGYLSIATIVFYVLGSVIGTYMALKMPTDGLRRAHLILQIGGTLCLAATIVLGVQLVLDLNLL